MVEPFPGEHGGRDAFCLLSFVPRNLDNYNINKDLNCNECVRRRVRRKGER